MESVTSGNKNSSCLSVFKNKTKKWIPEKYNVSIVRHINNIGYILFLSNIS